MYDDDANRMRVLLKISRDKLRSFFTVLQEVRKKIGDDAHFERWCIEELKVGLGVITNISNVLKKDDRLLTKGLAATSQGRGAREAKQLEAANIRIGELEKQLAEARAVRQPIHEPPASEIKSYRLRAEAAEQKLARLRVQKNEPPKTSHKPLRDRRDYMREFMRNKRAKEKR